MTHHLSRSAASGTGSRTVVDGQTNSVCQRRQYPGDAERRWCAVNNERTGQWCTSTLWRVGCDRIDPTQNNGWCTNKVVRPCTVHHCRRSRPPQRLTTTTSSGRRTPDPPNPMTGQAAAGRAWPSTSMTRPAAHLIGNPRFAHWRSPPPARPPGAPPPAAASRPTKVLTAAPVPPFALQIVS